VGKNIKVHAPIPGDALTATDVASSWICRYSLLKKLGEKLSGRENLGGMKGL
jgi:hypothetical protein